MSIRKVPASAGAEWLLGGFGLLHRSPFGLGLLGLIYGVFSLSIALLAQAAPDLILPLYVALMVVGPLLIAGMIYAAREVDEGRSAAPDHLLRGLQEGKAKRLIGTLLPQVVVLVLLVGLVYALIGPEQRAAIESLMQTLQSNPQAPPDPTMIASLPVGRLALLIVILIALAIVAGFFTFTAVPDLMFTDVGLFDSMRRSFRACIGNLPAMLVFFVLTVIVLIMLVIGVQLVAMLVGVVAGETAMAITGNLLMNAIFMPVFSAVMYFAWKQMIGGGGGAVTPVAGIEV